MEPNEAAEVVRQRLREAQEHLNWALIKLHDVQSLLPMLKQTQQFKINALTDITDSANRGAQEMLKDQSLWGEYKQSPN